MTEKSGASQVNTTKPRFYKRRFVMNRRFQYYFIILLLVVSMLIWALDLVAYQFFLKRTIATAEASGVDLLALHSFLSALRGGFTELMLTSLFITAAICGVVGLILSYHIAGPVYRTRMVIDQILKGEKVPTPIRLRTMDCFPELETALTELVHRVQKD